MEALHAIEIAITFWAQSLGDSIVPFMKAVTTLGNEEFYMLVMPLLFWCIDPMFGLRIGVMLILSNWVNSITKLALHASRPYWFDPAVRAFISEKSFGAPSGHAQNAASLWGLAAALIRKPWATAALLSVVFLIGFSRIFLGVHFTSDVVLGWLLGGLLLILYLRVEPSLSRWLKTLTLARQIALACLIALLMIVIGLVPHALLVNWQMPADWLENIAITSPDHLPHPTSTAGLFTITGTFLGMAIGTACYLSKYRRYDVSGSIFRRALRFLVGLAGILVLWFGLGELLPRGETWLPAIFRLFRYSLVTFWMSAAAPWLFIQLGLSSPDIIPSITGGTYEEN
ncbi:phosphatase PAP2 family protein [Ornatilinea apprima]|uniref:phosphatase PAP2 family protein n=1 Tax=Ornatilinea apprima TaxID=1134406 RepID=UPI0009463B1C|nr:phosphatase PAP2 family protein [Ornatilinea apprima]